MSRSSLRIKNYRPMSAEISSKPGSTLGTMFTIGGDPNDKSPEKNSGITLLNYKRSDDNSVPAIISIPPNGLAPIAQDEDLDTNCNEALDLCQPLNNKNNFKRSCKSANNFQNRVSNGRRASLPTHILLSSSSAAHPKVNRKLASTNEAGLESEDSFWGSDLEEELEEDFEERGGFESLSDTEEDELAVLEEETEALEELDHDDDHDHGDDDGDDKTAMLDTVDDALTQLRLMTSRNWNIRQDFVSEENTFQNYPIKCSPKFLFGKTNANAHN